MRNLKEKKLLGLLSGNKLIFSVWGVKPLWNLHIMDKFFYISGFGLRKSMAYRNEDSTKK